MNAQSYPRNSFPRINDSSRIFPLPVALALALVSCQKGGSTTPPWPNPEIDAVIVSVPEPAAPLPVDEFTPITAPQPAPPGYVCEWSHREVSLGSLSFPALAPHTDVIYPGADIQGQSLLGSIPDPITAARAGGTLAISNFSSDPASTARVLSEVNLGNVTQAVSEIVGGQPDDFPADLRLSIQQVRNREELQLSLNANGSYFGLFEASAGFNLQHTELTSMFLVVLQQNFFSIAFERPDLPSKFYAPGVTAQDIANQVYDGNPAGYVSQVTYGRVFYVLIKTTTEATQARAVLSANFLDLAEADGSIHYATQLQNVSIEAYAYGGLQSAVLGAIGGGLGSLSSFITNLANGNDPLAGKALSYTIRGVATDHAWMNAINAEYDFSDCTLVGQLIPTLYTPASGAVLDNGCGVDANVVTWTFDWSDCAGAEEYQLLVSKGSQTWIDQHTTNSTYTYATTGALGTSGWQWQVRCKRFGVWNSWSTARAFTLEPGNTDCTTKIRVYTHPDYQGDFTDFTGDIPNLENVPGGMDDDIDSLRLYNVHSVTLYEHPNYQGASYTFNHSCPDVQYHSAHAGQFLRNRASSLKVNP